MDVCHRISRRHRHPQRRGVRPEGADTLRHPRRARSAPRRRRAPLAIRAVPGQPDTCPRAMCTARPERAARRDGRAPPPDDPALCRKRPALGLPREDGRGAHAEDDVLRAGRAHRAGGAARTKGPTPRGEHPRGDAPVHHRPARRGRESGLRLPRPHVRRAVASPRTRREDEPRLRAGIDARAGREPRQLPRPECRDESSGTTPAASLPERRLPDDDIPRRERD